MFMLAALTLPSSKTEAAMNPSAAELYRAGQYEAAVAKGESVGDAESLTIAAQAANAITTLKGGPCLDCAKRAEALARRAIAADPERPRAYVCLVASMAFESRIIGVYASRNAHLPDEARRALDKALMLAPDDPWALTAMGGWHLEVVRSAGGAFGRILYGARINEGVDYFKRAVSADPDNPLIALNYALSLSSVAFNTRRDEIKGALQTAVKAVPHDAYEAAMKARAVELNGLLEKNARGAYLALASSYLGFPARSAF
jgi:tetratricopeptide (TPR) repeat protein